jgi:cytochrome c553
MMNKTKLILSSWLALSAAMLQASGAYAAIADVANGQAIFNEGKGDAAACMGCHGDKGLGNDGMGAPRLANIGALYIKKQLDDFADEKRVPDGAGAAMNGFAKALSAQDRLDVAVYLDTLEFEVENSDLKSLASDGNKVGRPDLGLAIVTRGIVSSKVPACQDCHGFNGRDPRFPMINQQKFVYLVNQLNAFKNATRTNDPAVLKVGIMRGIAKKLTEDDIANIATYLSTAPRVAPVASAGTAAK